MKNIDISFITINYNSSKYTIELIKSIQKYTSLSYEMIIVDNASKEDDINILKSFLNNQSTNIKLLENSINSGFANGNMLGVNYANAEYYFFINNDTRLLNDTSRIMKIHLDTHKEISLATARVNDKNGTFSSSYKLFPSLCKEIFGNSIARIFNKYPSNKIKLDTPTLVEVVSGSCMFFRSSTFNKINGFDQHFFLYCEEEDISKRIWESGSKVVFIPEAKIFHEAGGSTEKSFEIQREYHISYTYLIYKHFNYFKATILYILQILKLLRRSFKSENGYKLLICGLNGFKNSSSLKYTQNTNNPE